MTGLVVKRQLQCGEAAAISHQDSLPIRNSAREALCRGFAAHTSCASLLDERRSVEIIGKRCPFGDRAGQQLHDLGCLYQSSRASQIESTFRAIVLT